MATASTAVTPAQQARLDAEAAGFLLTRQIVRFYNDNLVLPSMKDGKISRTQLFLARWLLEETSAQAGWAHPEKFNATPDEEQYPQAWIQPHGLETAMAAFDQFAKSRRRGWLPTSVLDEPVLWVENDLKFPITMDPTQPGQWVLIQAGPHQVFGHHQVLPAHQVLGAP